MVPNPYESPARDSDASAEICVSEFGLRNMLQWFISDVCAFVAFFVLGGNVVGASESRFQGLLGISVGVIVVGPAVGILLGAPYVVWLAFRTRIRALHGSRAVPLIAGVLAFPLGMLGVAVADWVFGISEGSIIALIVSPVALAEISFRFLIHPVAASIRQPQGPPSADHLRVTASRFRWQIEDLFAGTEATMNAKLVASSVVVCISLVISPSHAIEPCDNSSNSQQQEVLGLKQAIAKVLARLEQLEQRISELEKTMGRTRGQTETQMRPLGSRMMVDQNGIIWEHGRPVGIWGVDGADPRMPRPLQSPPETKMLELLPTTPAR